MSFPHRRLGLASLLLCALAAACGPASTATSATAAAPAAATPSAAAPVAAEAQDASARIAHGRALAEEHCARCHAIGATGDSPYAPAPPWREAVESGNIDVFAQAFAEGRLVHHEGQQTMPDFMFSAADIADLIAYIKTLHGA